MRTLLLLGLLSIVAVGCLPDSGASVRPAAPRPARAVVVTEHGVRPTPRPCGPACDVEPTATRDEASFARLVATAAAMPTVRVDAELEATRVALTVASPRAAASPTARPLMRPEDASLIASILGVPRSTPLATPARAGQSTASQSIATPRAAATATTGPPVPPSRPTATRP